MATKSFDRAAFGSQSARFTLNGVHPNMLYTGRMPYDSKITAPAGSHLAPGTYDQLKYSEFSEVNVARKAEGPNWERASYTEKIAKIPNLLYQETFKKKQEDKRRLGPGYYDPQEPPKPVSNRGMLDALTDRWAYVKLSENPGPFEYGIPDEKLEDRRKNKKPGTCPSFERSKEPRHLPFVGSEVPPGTYKHKNSIDELLKKRVSTRGPYDLFSEERSGPPKSGPYIPDPNPILGPGSYELRGFVDEIHHYGHAKHGKFGKLEQYPVNSGDRLGCDNVQLQPRYPSFPGPGQYDPTEMSKATVNSPPFLISSIRDSKLNMKRFNHNFNKCGVGRYDITKPDANRHINSHKSLFLSKSAQITKTEDQKYNAERIRPVGLNHKEKISLFLTGNVSV